MADYYSYFLPLSVLVPLLTAVALLLLAEGKSELTRGLAMIGFTLPFVFAVWFAIGFYQSSLPGDIYQGIISYDTGLSYLGIQMTFGINGISMPLFLLAGIVGLAAGMYATYSNARRLHLYLALLLIMLAGLMGTFACMDVFFFYFFHELALIPTFIMIGIWGGQQRYSAAIEMTIYLTLGAMLSLIGLIALYMEARDSGAMSFDFDTLRSYIASRGLQGAMADNTFALLMFGFGILVSLWPMHSWAPRGYAAAPSSTAMLHAGVLKKFGLYGLIQLGAPLIPAYTGSWLLEMLLWLALGNIVIIGLVTIAQRDLKLMLGYASVMHMGYAFLGIATLDTIGVGGAVLMMFAHGLSASLLFMLATSIFRRTHSYDLYEQGGLGQRTPLLAGFFIAGTMASIGLPGFANFWGEFTIFVGLWESYAWAVVPAALGIIISAIYGLRAVARVFFGEPTESLRERVNLQEIEDIHLHERAPAILLMLALLVAGVYPKLISDRVNDSVRTTYASVASEPTSQEALVAANDTTSIPEQSSGLHAH